MQVKPVMRLMRPACLRFVAVAVLLPSLLCPALLGQESAERELDFEGKHRVNAHGDEFNGLVKSSDGQRLFICTEKGDTIVWNIAARRIEQRLHQSRPIHLIAALADSQEFVAAGSHHYQPRNAEVRKWNAKTGTSVELQGVEKSSFPAALATEPKAGLIAVTTLEGGIHVWDAASTKLLASWNIKDVPAEAALIGRNLYVSTVGREAFKNQEDSDESAIIRFAVDDPKSGPAEYLRVPGRTWHGLDVSPDRRLLSATYASDEERIKTVLIEPTSKAELGKFSTRSHAWINSSKLVLFDWMNPVEIAELQSSGPLVIRKLERMEDDTDGRAFALTGQVANADGSKAWATYSKGGALLEFDLVTNKIKTHISSPGVAAAISVDTANGEDGHLLTGGSDGYVRLWKLSDISLLKEYQPRGPEYFIRDAVLLPGARRAVVGVVRDRKDREEQQLEPVELLLVDFETGQHKKITQAFLWWTRIAVVDNQIVVPEGDRIRMLSVENGQVTREFRLGGAIMASAVSENRKWFATVDHSRKLTIVDLTTFKLKTTSFDPEQNEGPLVVTNDGRYVYVVTRQSELRGLEVATSKTTTATLTRIREMHTNVDFITLANDDKWVVTAGNHGDVGIFDRVSGQMVSYTRVSAAAFWVERAWVRGDRLIFTTDTGVLFDGRLK